MGEAGTCNLSIHRLNSYLKNKRPVIIKIGILDCSGCQLTGRVRNFTGCRDTASCACK